MSEPSEPRYPYVHVDVAPDDVDETSGLLFELGAQGVEERDESTLQKNASAGRVTLVASFASREEAEAAMRDLDPAVSPRYEEVVGDAWRDAWKEHFRPFPIAEGIVVRPPWEAYDAKPGERVLELEPGRAFGTGLHETTRLVAQALKRHESEVRSTTILDVGCGSGILALVALTLGARSAIAIDTDPEAVDVTRENAARNGVTLDASTMPIESCEAIAPVVLANIEARVLVPMAPALAARVAPGGLLLLSGILVTQKDDVRAAYADFALEESPALGEWVMLALRKAR
ncbi:MAG TPA: 50S ribosomal protein L11 methyltransferase [Labilithrix sp.]|jgi:ribosomal protein L11 methyltransferase